MIFISSLVKGFSKMIAGQHLGVMTPSVSRLPTAAKPSFTSSSPPWLHLISCGCIIFWVFRCSSLALDWGGCWCPTFCVLFLCVGHDWIVSQMTPGRHLAFSSMPSSFHCPGHSDSSRQFFRVPSTFPSHRSRSSVFLHLTISSHPILDSSYILFTS
jgi:hypothetical protein